MIKGYIKNSDITLLNDIYHYPKKMKNGKWSKGAISLIYRDNITKQKKLEIIENPTYKFYIAKPDISIDHHSLFIDKNKVDEIEVPYRNLEKKIAELTDNLDFFYDNIRSGNRKLNRSLHTHPKIFNSDMNIEDYYKYQFSKMYKNKSYQISKSYFDIEADTINMKGDFPEMGECPINAITIINEFNNKTFTFLLRNSKNPLIAEFEKSINKNLFIELKNFIKNKVGGWKNEIRYGLDKMEYELLFYDEEIQLIQDFFRLINYIKPDFVLAWNMAFDIPYIIQRLINLGYNPASIMCHPDFKYKECRYYIDNKDINKKNSFAERGDFATISSYSVYLDQLIQFASRRKSKIKSFDNLKLDYIGEIIAGVRKLDYSDITTNIAEFPWKDYKTFVFYNIMDTIVQKCIETKVNDIDYTFNKCLINNTRYSKCHRQTVYIINRACDNFNKDGFIIGNNNNRHNKKEPYPGGFAASSLKINDYPKSKINKQSINIYPNCNDFDYKSLYPSVMREFNTSPNTQKGKIYINDKIYNNENPFNNNEYDRGGAFLEDLQSCNYLDFCYRWMHLANYKELYYDIIYYLSHIKLSSFDLNMFDKNGYIQCMRRTNNLCINPIKRTSGCTNPFIRFNKKPNCDCLKNIKMEDLVNNE